MEAAGILEQRLKDLRQRGQQYCYITILTDFSIRTKGNERTAGTTAAK